MTTHGASTSTTPTNPFLAWSRQEGARRAALTRKGIEWRSPAYQAVLRLRAVCATADPGAVRLLLCDLAEGVAGHVTTALPGDLRPALILWTARRYARGEASDAERRAARQVAFTLADALDTRTWPQRAAQMAAEVVAFTVIARIAWAVEPASEWLADLSGMDVRQYHTQLAAQMEALPRR